MSNFELIIYPPASPIAFNLFGFPVRFYGIIIALALFIGYFSVSKFLEKKYDKNDANKFVDYSLYLVLISIIGARLFYVLGSFAFYRNNPLEIFMINHGGISIWGGILLGIVGLYVLSKIFKFSFYIHSAVISVFMPLCQAIGRWGNYFNQEAFGAPSDFIVKLFVSESYRPSQYVQFEYFHPAFLYESILDLAIFIVLLSSFKKANPAKTFYLYIILYSLVRIAVEAIRIDSILNLSKIHIATIIAILAMIAGIVGLILSLKKPRDGA